MEKGPPLGGVPQISTNRQAEKYHLQGCYPVSESVKFRKVSKGRNIADYIIIKIQQCQLF